MSSVDLDGGHTPAIRGGEEVGYQGRKKRKTTNALYLTDRKGLPLAMSAPKSGEHHDTHNIVATMQDMMADMAKANIRTDGLFLNADAGFDCVPSAQCSKLMELWQTSVSTKEMEREMTV